MSESARLAETRWVALLDLGPNDDGAALMYALTHNALMLERVLPSWMLAPARDSIAPLVEALVRRWLGAEASERLQVGDTRLTHWCRCCARRCGC